VYHWGRYIEKKPPGVEWGSSSKEGKAIDFRIAPPAGWRQEPGCGQSTWPLKNVYSPDSAHQHREVIVTQGSAAGLRSGNPCSLSGNCVWLSYVRGTFRLLVSEIAGRLRFPDGEGLSELLSRIFPFSLPNCGNPSWNSSPPKFPKISRSSGPGAGRQQGSPVRLLLQAPMRRHRDGTQETRGLARTGFTSGF
jgi:hypothetical protein